MRRLLLLTAAGLTVVALAGAVGLPDLASAQDATATRGTITTSGVGTVDAVPNEAQMSFGAETRKPTAQTAVAANADAMRQIINSCGPEDFPVRPARHCGMCSFLRICYAGRQTMPHRISRTPPLALLQSTGK